MNPIKVEKNIDINKFMGDWYVIAYTPFLIDKNAFNGVESYKLNQKGQIETTYTFNKDSFDGEKKKYTPKGFIKKNTGNAIWKMQFIFPFKSDYRIMFVDEDYQDTIIARNKRDLFWVMSKNKNLSKEKTDFYLGMLKAEGYELNNYRLMPHK